jgi:hypothetical protein
MTKYLVLGQSIQIILTINRVLEYREIIGWCQIVFISDYYRLEKILFITEVHSSTKNFQVFKKLFCHDKSI